MNKKVVITGGSGDIAHAIACEVKQQMGYEVFLPSRHELDVCNQDNINDYFNKIKPDILINNAGAILLKGIEYNIESHLNVLNVNLLGLFLCTSAVVRLNKNAKIINIGSSAGTKPHANWSSYCASKAAVIMATKCWADEGLDTICISPGRALTKMRKSMYPNENPNTLMMPVDFARVVVKAINNEYQRGINLDVNVNNVKELINE